MMIAPGYRSGGLTRVLAGALACALALSACEEKAQTIEEPDVTEPAASSLSAAAIYECDDGREIRVVYYHENQPDILLQIGGGDFTSLAPSPDADSPAWSNGRQSFKDLFGEAVYQEQGSAPVACRGASRPLPPPVAPGVVRNLTAADAGATVEVSVGQTFSISLSDVPTAGYAWSGLNVPAFLEQRGQLGGATTTAQFLPGYTGGNHWIVLVYEAVAAGEADLELVQKRPWEDRPEPGDSRYRIRVKAN